jgi:hypothetical protein
MGTKTNPPCEPVPEGSNSFKIVCDAAPSPCEALDFHVSEDGTSKCDAAPTLSQTCQGCGVTNDGQCVSLDELIVAGIQQTVRWDGGRRNKVPGSSSSN